MTFDRLFEPITINGLQIPNRIVMPSLMKSLRSLGVELRTRTRLLEISDDGVRVMTEQGEETIPADTVVLAVGVSPVQELDQATREEEMETIVLGNAGKPGTIGEAGRQGFEAALQI